MAKKQLAMKVDHVSMRFNLSSEKVDNIKEYVIKMIKKELMFQEFWALRDISFEVKKGDRNWVPDLTSSIPVLRIFSFMEPCLVTARSFWKKNMMRL